MTPNSVRLPTYGRIIIEYSKIFVSYRHHGKLHFVFFLKVAEILQKFPFFTVNYEMKRLKCTKPMD